MSTLPISPPSLQGDPIRIGLPSIALVGKAGAGKSTAAGIIAHQLGYRRLSFASPLKDIAQTLWGTEALTDRSKLQLLGVAVRAIETDTWVDLLVKRAALNDEPVVVDDCRFPNEYWALKGEGFVVVRIEAERATRIGRLTANGKLQDVAQLEHESETALDDFLPDHTINNDDAKVYMADALMKVIDREARSR